MGSAFLWALHSLWRYLVGSPEAGRSLLWLCAERAIIANLDSRHSSGCSSVDRVLASEAKGRGFDPRQPHHTFTFFVAFFKVTKKLC